MKQIVKCKRGSVTNTGNVQSFSNLVFSCLHENLFINMHLFFAIISFRPIPKRIKPQIKNIYTQTKKCKITTYYLFTHDISCVAKTYDHITKADKENT